MGSVSTRVRRAHTIASHCAHARTLNYEMLEDRRMLALVTVDTHLDVFDSSDGEISLREAIFAANLIDGADTIDFDAALAGKTILLTLGELIIADSLTIVGLGADQLFIDASGNDPTPALNNGDGSRVFNVYDSNDLIDVDIRDLTLSGGDSALGGGAISVDSENLTVSRLSITENSTTNLGGGIQNLYGTLVVSESFIENNSAAGNGGGIHSLQGELTLAQSTVSNNSSAHDAGGIWSSGTAVIIDSSVLGNTSDGVGGGLKSTGSLTISLSTISENSAFDQGGGIWIDGTAMITTSSIVNNYSQSRGGGLFTESSSVISLSGSTVSSNIAVHTGGGIEGRESEITLIESTVTGNTASGTGAGIRNDIGQLTVARSTISGNSAADGGGIWSFLATTSIYQSTISGNSADDKGGGIYSLGGDLTISNSTITENIADSDSNGTGTGGGIHGDATIDHTIVANNFRAVSMRDDLSGSLAASFSLIGDESGALITDNGGNYIGSALSPIDPLLVPLSDNGGSAFTHALLPTSPALDAGNISLRQGDPGVPEFDQRNSPYVRVVGTRVDIGAIEQEGIPIVVDTLDDESDGDFSRFDISLREALELANAQPGGQTISFDPLLTGGSIVLTMGELEIRDSVEIQGLGASQSTIDASGNDPTPDSIVSDRNNDNDGDGSRIFNIDDFQGSKIDVIISGLTLTGGDAYEAGGAINSQENLYLNEVSIIENNSRDSGGGVYSNGNLTLRKSHVADNSITINAFTPGGAGLYVQPSNGGYLTIFDSTIINNFTYRSGGGLYLVNHDAQVQITDSVFSENQGRHGGGIFISSMTPSSTTEILRTQITDNRARGDGGGIHVTGGRLHLVDSRILRNTTGNINTGGGIKAYEVDQLIIENSVIEENFAGEYVGGFGGGIDFRQGGWDGELIIQDTLLANNRASLGGAVAITESSFTTTGKDQVLVNSTISGNESFGGGGGIWTEDNLTIAHSTITDNISDINFAYGGTGGGINVDSGIVSLDHSIVAGNLDNTGAAHDIHGAYNSSFSLVGEGGDFFGTLANNGGFTRSHALLPGSPAIDAGDSAAIPGAGGVPIYDQRGSYFSRVFGGRIDIGAYEGQHLGSSQTWVVDTLTDEKDGDYSVGDLSLREAIGLANGNQGFSDNISFDTGLDGGTVLLTLGELIVVDSLTIDASNLSNGLTINASGNDPTPGVMRDDGSRIVLIDDGSSAVIDVEIRGLTLTGGDLFGSGGAIFSAENLSVSSSLISGNAARFDAGGIYAIGPLFITGSTISGNTAGGIGGGVHSSGQVDVISSTFSNNFANNDAGGIYNTDTLVVSHSTISNNSAGDNGGGIFASGSINIFRTKVWNNTAAAEGGGIAVNANTAHISNSSFIGNIAGSRGGAIIATLGTFVLDHSDVANNSANGDGGGLTLISSLSTITGSSIAGNTAGGMGGGIMNSSGPLTLYQSTISGNSASRNAGGIYNSLSTAEILDSTISGNWTAMNGGGIYTFLGTAEVLRSTISGNSANFNAGGIGVGLFSDANIRHSTITNNTSDADNDGVGNGGGIHTPNNVTVLDHTIVAGNHDNTGQAPEIAGSVISSFSLVGIGATYLGPLADNGGPTLTHALLAGSPAIDTGDTTLMGGVGDTPNFDQRGVPFSRIAGPRIDIGALEEADAPIIVDTLIDESDGDLSRFDVSLREAIELANNQPGADTITFDPSLFANGPESILVTIVGDSGLSGIGSAFRIRGETTILGPGAALLTIDVSPLDPTPDENNGDGIRGFRIDDNYASQAKVLFSGMTLTGGDITYFNVYNGGGGAIHSTENLELQSVHVVDNSSKYGGGVISVGDLTIHDSLFADNESDWGGGAIKIYGSSLVVTHSTLSNNQTSSEGGGINLENSVALIEDSTFINNSASQAGGLFFLDSNATIRNLLITANNAGSYGGGISIEGSNLAIFDTSIVDNNSGRAAGISSANFRGNYLVTMSNSLVARNISDNDGGGMRLTGGELYISNSTISQNQSGGSGGGIQLVGATLTLAHSTVTGNIARLSKSFGAGGGISMQSLSSTGLPNNLHLNHSIIAGNTDLSNAAPDIAFTTLPPSPAPTKLLTSSYSLIGDSTGTNLAEAPLGSPDANGNLIGGPINGIIDPLLDPLADNGGPTLTHALQAGSPAVDAGDLSLQQGDPSLPEFDQRGAAFARVTGGQIDMGAYESQSSGGSLSADFNSDGDTDGFDFLTWQRSFGVPSGAILADGDATGDGDVDSNDAAVWEATFGEMSLAPATSYLVSELSSIRAEETTIAFSVPATPQSMSWENRTAGLSASIILQQGLTAAENSSPSSLPFYKHFRFAEYRQAAFSEAKSFLNFSTYNKTNEAEWTSELAKHVKHERSVNLTQSRDDLFAMLDEEEMLALF